MITETTFNGGSRFTTLASLADVTVPFMGERVQTYKNNQAGAVNVILPDKTKYRSNQAGGPHFYVYNDSTSTQNLVIKDGSTTIATITPDQCLVVMLSSSGWRGITRTRGTARSIGKGTSAALANPDSSTSYDPFCFEGTCCEYAVALGNEPLDGRDSRPNVLAPMFQDPCMWAKNEAREPIRAADVVMPKIIVLQFFRGEFVNDAAHPYGASDLSAEFYEALYANDRSHGLDYNAALSTPGRSDHWHHVRLSGNAPSSWAIKAGGLTVQRHVWQKLKTYGPADDPAKYTLDIRFVMEHTVNPQPLHPDEGIDCEDKTGGLNDDTYGAWGAVFHIYVFTNEILFGSSDPISYTPAGGSSSVSFTRANPAIWGNADGIAGGDDVDKFCHPQMVLCACLPTTFQSPCGMNWVPMVDRKTGKSFGDDDTDLKLKNREYCYTVGNGSPWCSANTSPNTISDAYGRWGNIVFGYSNGGYLYAAMSTGGDLPTSRITEYVCFENGGGVGRTVLIPEKPGWDECQLTVEDGSSASICICTGDNDCADPGNCSEGWPACKDSPCTGHPNEPFEGVGGSHRCFHNNGTDTSSHCCVAIVNAGSNITQYCTRLDTEYGDFNGTDCDLGPQTCHVVGTYFTQATLYVEDYDYVMNGSQDARVLSWLRLLPDPDKPARDYEYDSTNVGDLHQDLGTWTIAAGTVSPSAYAGGGAGAVRALLRYDPAVTWDWDGCIQTGTINKLQLGTHGVGVGYKTTNGFTGYGGLTESTGANEITIYIKKYDDGVATILASTVVNTNSATCTFRWEQHGTDFKWRITISGTSTEITAQDCEFVNGTSAPCLFSEDTAGTDVEFASDWSIEDTVRSMLEISAVLGKELVTITWDPALTTGYGQCGDITNASCGVCSGGCTCNCITSTYSLVGDYTATHNTGDIVIPECPDTDGDNPTVLGGSVPQCNCNGEWCSGTSWYCGDCPRPFANINFAMPTDCRTDDQILTDTPSRGSLCSGVTWWWISGVACF